MNVTLEQAKALSAVPCPACGGTGFIFVPGSVPDQDKCEPCDGRGTLAFPSEWPQLVWVKDIEQWVMQYYEQVDYERYLKTFNMQFHPAPDAIRALMWLESAGVIALAKSGELGRLWYTYGVPTEKQRRAGTPEALLDAVLAALTRTPAASL